MENKHQLIYELIINKLPITVSTIKEIGLTENDITEMLESKFLKEVSDMQYELKDIDLLYQYGIKLLKQGYFNKSSICFKKCFETEPNNREYILQLILFSFRTAYYYEIFKIFPLLDKCNSEKDIKDNNIYLYLLSITSKSKMPIEYLERVRKLEEKDLLLSSECEYESKEIENTITSLIIKNKYKYALKLVNDELAKDSSDITKMFILKELLNAALKREDKFKYDLIKFAKNKEYSKIELYLETISKKRLLRSDETYTYMITKAIIKMLKTEKIPPVTAESPHHIYHAIKGNNFRFAKILNYYYKVNNNKADEIDIIDILLSDILELIEQIKLKNNSSDELNGPTLIKQL